MKKQQKHTPRLEILTGFQAFLQLLIVLYHYFEMHSWESKEVFKQKIKAHEFPDYPVNGFIAVGLFFALSGFMAGFTSYKRFETLTGRGYLTYLVKRFSRLAFLYYASLLVGIICVFDFHKNAWDELSYSQLTILVPGIIFWNEKMTFWNAPLWFVSQLMWFYMLAPVIVRFWRRLPKLFLLIWLAVAYGSALSSFIWAYSIQPLDVSLKVADTDSFWFLNSDHSKDSIIPKLRSEMFYFAWIHQGLSFSFLQFFMGLILGIYMKKFPTQPLPFATDILTLIFLGMLLACSIATAGDRNMFYRWMYWDRFAAFPIYLCMIYNMALNEGILAKVLYKNYFMMKLGGAAYALYVLHTPIWRWMRVKSEEGMDYTEYSYGTFKRTRLLYQQFPFVFFVTVCVALVMADVDAYISPKFRDFLLRKLGLQSAAANKSAPMIQEERHEETVEVSNITRV